MLKIIPPKLLLGTNWSSGLFEKIQTQKKLQKDFKKTIPDMEGLLGIGKKCNFFKKTHAKNYPIQTAFENHTKARGLAKIND